MTERAVEEEGTPIAAHALTMSADVLEEAVGPFVAYAATAKAPVPIKSRCVCVSLAKARCPTQPVAGAEDRADVQSGFVALMVVVDCVRPPRRRTLCRRRDLVIIQAAAFGSTPLQAELVQEHLVRRGRFSPAAQARIVVRVSFLLAKVIGGQLHSVLFFNLQLASCKTLASVPSVSVYASSVCAQ